MKKLLSVVLVLVLVLSMSLVAFAEDSPVTINKNLILLNSGTVSPAETFNFTVGNGSVEDGNATVAPAFPSGTFTINLAQGAITGSTDIALPDFDHVGVYLYEVKEVGGNTAGMTYSAQTHLLEVTVLNAQDGESLVRLLTRTADEEGNYGTYVKTDAFENSFSAGNLVINKTITGNYAVFDDEFDVTVILSPPEGKVIKEGPITIANGIDGNVAPPNDDGEVIVTFKVSHNSEVTIANIPYGVSYVVTEDAGDYDSNVPEGGFIGTIGEASTNIGLVNTLNTEIVTGINLDNLPYILILGFATIGLFGFTMKRRFNK